MTSAGNERLALVAGGFAVLVLAVALPTDRWGLAGTAVIPAHLAVRALLSGVEVRGGRVVVRNVLKTTKLPVANVDDIVVEEVGMWGRQRAALRLRSGLELPLDGMSAGRDDVARHRLDEEVVDLRRRIDELRRGGEI